MRLRLPFRKRPPLTSMTHMMLPPRHVRVITRQNDCETCHLAPAVVLVQMRAEPQLFYAICEGCADSLAQRCRIVRRLDEAPFDREVGW